MESSLEVQLQRQQELDELFVQILEQVHDLVISSASKSVGQILSLSSHFLSEEAQRSVADFHKLYAARDGIRQDQEKVNQDVSDFVEQLQEDLAAGKDLDAEHGASDVIGDEASDAMRLSLSGVQKQLEGLIRLEGGIRKRLFPILSNLQFEDVVKQRMNHIRYIWTLVMRQLVSERFDIVESSSGLSEILTSHAEKKLYAEIVLREDLGEDEGLDDVDALDDLLAV